MSSPELGCASKTAGIIKADGGDRAAAAEAVDSERTSCIQRTAVFGLSLVGSGTDSCPLASRIRLLKRRGPLQSPEPLAMVAGGTRMRDMMRGTARAWRTDRATHVFVQLALPEKTAARI